MMGDDLTQDLKAFAKDEGARSDAALREQLVELLDAAFPSWRKEPDLADALVSALAGTARDYHFRELFLSAPNYAHDRGCGAEYVRASMADFAARYPVGAPLGGAAPIGRVFAVTWAKGEVDRRRRDATFERKMKRALQGART